LATESHTPVWFLVSGLALIAVAAILLVAALGNRLYASNLSFAALAVVLVLLGFTAFLYVRAWYLERRGVYATERQFESVYRHALDAILILDDHGVCLDANPAAIALLGAHPVTIVGHSFAQFYERQQGFESQWRMFRECRYQRGQTELVRTDGGRVCVHYTISADPEGHNVLILCDVTERIRAEDSLRQSQERFQQISDNIHEIVWMMDAETKQIVEVNRAYETITGRSLESIASDPSSYADLIHPADRVQILAKLEEAAHSGRFDEEFRIVRPDGEVRWVSVKASPVPAEGNMIRQLVGTTQDVTARKRAEAQVAEHLAAAEAARDQADAARGEAEALRKATLALTQNLSMDAVLDTLLETVRQIVPFEMASVLLTEEEGRLFVARSVPASSSNRPVITLELAENPLLQRATLSKKSVYVEDTHEERDWRENKPFLGVRGWIAVPLVVSDNVLGLLTIGSATPGSFAAEHVRLARSLAIPAAVAIHNARLYEWAQIYANERQTLLKKADVSRKTEDRDPLAN